MPAAHTVIARLPACKASTVLDPLHAVMGWVVWDYCERPEWSAEFDSRADCAEYLATFRQHDTGRRGEHVRTLSDGTLQVSILGRWETVEFTDSGYRIDDVLEF